MVGRGFSGRSTREVLSEIKRRLGPDAVIVGNATSAGGAAAEGGVRLEISACSAGEIAASRAASSVAAYAPAGIRSIDGQLARAGFSQVARQALIEGALTGTAASRLDDPSALHEAILMASRRLCTAAGEIALERGRARRVALVGPSGAGKTSAIIKLATRLLGASPLTRIAVLSGNPAGAGRLGALSAALGVIVTPVQTPAEWRAVVAGTREGVIFLDTPGVSVARPEALAGLITFLCDAGIDETHVVLPATIDSEEARDLVCEMKGAPGLRLFVSKADEAASAGRIASFLLDAPLPLSYVATGPNPLGDLAPVDSALVAEWVARALQRGARPEPSAPRDGTFVGAARSWEA